jgi:hypothetical protein
MIEDILKKKDAVFSYGTVADSNQKLQKVQVRLRSNLLIWIRTSLVLNSGDTVTVAKNDKDSSWFIVQYSKKAVPSQGTLLLV